jgi:GxxExxY protein
MEARMQDDQAQLTEAIIGAAIEIHRQLGPGLLESAYQACLAYEMSERGIRFDREKPMPVVYKGVRVDCGYRLDFVVHGAFIVEVKAVVALEPIHQAQLLTYLALSGLEVGLLINFNARVLKEGIRRFVR